MKIVSYKKKNKNIYEIELSNEKTLNLFDEVILKYELLLKKEIKEKDLEEILNYNKKVESYYEALKYLNKKLRTENEIRNKLQDYDKDAIEFTINKLKENGYLDKILYIKSYINDEVNLKFVGNKKILSNLKKLGFDEEDIKNVLNSYDESIWYDKIKKYIKKRIDTNRNLSGNLLRQKIIQELINKGFYVENITEVLSNFDFVDKEEIKEKEYNKLKNKLNKKYSGIELEYRIKINLLKKGFN